MDDKKLPDGTFVVKVTEDTLLAHAAATVEQSSSSGGRPSTQERERRQKNKLQKKIVRDVRASTEALTLAQPPTTHVPEVWTRWKEMFQRNLERNCLAMGVEETERVRFVESVLTEVGHIRTRNKKLLKLHNQIERCTQLALKNCLFKLATCEVRMQPAPTPGWSWLVGSKDDNEYHVFRDLSKPDTILAYCGVTLCYEAGCRGDESRILSMAQLSRDNAAYARFKILRWNQRNALLDAMIDKVEAADPTQVKLCAGPEGSLASQLEDDEQGTEDDEPMAVTMRQDRNKNFAEMCAACEELSVLEDRGKDLSASNIQISMCMAKQDEALEIASSVWRMLLGRQPIPPGY